MTPMKVHEGNIITQTVERIKEGQMVLVLVKDYLQLGSIKTINGNSAITVENDEDGYIGIEKMENLRRIVVTDGEKYAPLQNEDWAEALSSGVIDSKSNIKYIIIERKIGDRTIRLARIYKPRPKINKLSKEEIQTAFFDALEYADEEMSIDQKQHVFDQFWKKVSDEN